MYVVVLLRFAKPFLQVRLTLFLNRFFQVLSLNDATIMHELVRDTRGRRRNADEHSR